VLGRRKFPQTSFFVGYSLILNRKRIRGIFLVHNQFGAKMKSVRVSVKAVIIENGKLFVMHYLDSVGDYYMLPGGGQRSGEPLVAAVKRECFEEAGILVSVGDVMYIRDYIEENHEFAGREPGFHQVEIMFKCEILDGSQIGKGIEMDARQIGVSWLLLDELDQYRLYPVLLKKVLLDNRNGSIYLGDIN
jgi:8-oxo-dGTP diphosphatase